MDSLLMPAATKTYTASWPDIRHIQNQNNILTPNWSWKDANGFETSGQLESWHGLHWGFQLLP